MALSSHGHIVLESEAIVDSRKLQKGPRVLTQVLVKWFDCPIEDNTWLDVHTFIQQFPDIILEGKDS